MIIDWLEVLNDTPLPHFIYPSGKLVSLIFRLNCTHILQLGFIQSFYALQNLNRFANLTLPDQFRQVDVHQRYYQSLIMPINFFSNLLFTTDLHLATKDPYSLIVHKKDTKSMKLKWKVVQLQRFETIDLQQLQMQVRELLTRWSSEAFVSQALQQFLSFSGLCHTRTFKISPWKWLNRRQMYQLTWFVSHRIDHNKGFSCFPVYFPWKTSTNLVGNGFVHIRCSTVASSEGGWGSVSSPDATRTQRVQVSPLQNIAPFPGWRIWAGQQHFWTRGTLTQVSNILETWFCLGIWRKNRLVFALSYVPLRERIWSQQGKVTVSKIYPVHVHKVKEKCTLLDECVQVVSPGHLHAVNTGAMWAMVSVPANLVWNGNWFVFLWRTTDLMKKEQPKQNHEGLRDQFQIFFGGYQNGFFEHRAFFSQSYQLKKMFSCRTKQKPCVAFAEKNLTTKHRIKCARNNAQR